jgi:uncharacterized small protein (DUF1192 family)
MPMSLDGLRAWIGEVERKLGARTRVFLVLMAIAIGASGAAIYLALEADDGGDGATPASGGATVEEVQSLREQVELEGGGAEVSSLEAQIVELRTELEALKAEGGAGKDGKDAGGGGGAAAEPIPEIEAK